MAHGRPAATGSRSLLRRLNTLGILSVVRRGPCTVSDVVRETGLSRTAAEAVLLDLVELGWIAVTTQTGRPTTPGRPAISYGVVPGIAFVASVDIGAHHVYAAIADLQGEVVASHNVDAEEAQSAEVRLALARSVLDEVLRTAGLTIADIWVLAVGSPGVIDNGVVIHFGGEGMPGWVGLDLRAEFAATYACPVLVEGDCALGAIAEQWKGAATEASDVVYVLSGTRTGSAVIANGQLHRGARGGAGLIGELAEIRWRELAHERYGAGEMDPRPSRQEIFAAAREGNEAARRTVADFGEVLALGTAAMVLAVDPQLVVIGGRGAQDSELYLDRFEARLAALCPLVPMVRISTLGPEAVGLGGLRLGLLRVDASLDRFVREAESFPTPTPEVTRGTPAYSQVG